MSMYLWFFVIIVISSGWLIWFLFNPIKSNDIDIDKSNIGLGKRKLAELKQDLANDMIDSVGFNEANSEIAQTLAQELKQKHKPYRSENPKVSLLVVSAILIFMTAFSFGTYQLLSKEVVVSNVQKDKQQPVTIEQSIEQIKIYLLDSPTDFAAWASLGGMYTELANFSGALESYERSYQLNSTDPSILSDYASAIFFANNQEFNQKSIDLLKQALAIDSSLPFALYQIGLYAASNGDFVVAKMSWQRALMSIHDDNPDKQYIENLIAQLDESMSTEDTTKSNIPDAGKFSVTINVVISEETRSDRSEDDYIMIYVKAAQGRPMPIAIQKTLLKDFSGEVNLSDKDSVMPTKMLSEAEKVVVVVRISASGSAVMQEGDVHVQSDIVDVKSNPVVNIKI